MNMTTDQEREAQKARDFERATSLLPPDVYWGYPINSAMVLAIAEAATARQASELEALRKDAERYEWLKESESIVWPSVDLANACHAASTSGDDSLIDAEIDRQMAPFFGLLAAKGQA